MKVFLRILGFVAAVVVLLGALWMGSGFWFWHKVGSPEEFSPQQAREMLSSVLWGLRFSLSDAEKVEHGWQDHHWLDPKRCFLLRSTPERMAALRAELLAANGRQDSLGKLEVTHDVLACGLGREPCPRHESRPGDKWPDWWNTHTLRDAERFSASYGTHGFRVLLSVPDGLAFIEAWKT